MPIHFYNFLMIKKSADTGDGLSEIQKLNTSNITFLSVG